jgi:hypothetical protein
VAGKFELDSWGTTYREAAQYIDQIAPCVPRVAVSDPVDVFREYARSDLKLAGVSNPPSDVHYDFIVSHGGENDCRLISPDRVRARGGAALGAVKVPTVSVTGCPRPFSMKRNGPLRENR